ncbi:MAG: sporulation protein YtfJ [Chloroflexi bacterium]|nr:sporulation protein YtfJ [Chloroflexota bacterium]MBL7062408.1 sporulation protein YtfJ [Dehalococcoidia bacterium]
MEDIEKLIKTTLGEIEKVLDSKTVVGEPITIEGITLIPLMSVGFGFAAGGGTGKGETKEETEGGGSGTGGGGGVKPIAVIVIDKDGVRIEPIKGGMATAMEKLSETIPDIAAKLTEKWGDRKKEGEK